MRYLIAILLFLNVAYAADEPVVRFNFDENAASTTVTNYGSGADGTASANTDTMDATGVIEGALEFNGSSDEIDYGSDPIGTADVTIAAWVKAPCTNYPIFAGNGRVQIGVNASCTVFASANGSLIIYSESGAVGNDEWTHVAMTIDYSELEMELFVNGESSGGKQSLSAILAGTHNLHIGSNDGTNYWTGEIDDLFIFDEVLTDTEIRSIYKRGIKNWTVPGQPVVYIKAEDNAANTTVTNSGSGADGTSANNTSTMSATGKIDLGFDFDPTANDVINTGSDVLGAGADSGCAWIRPDDFEGGNAYIISNKKTEFGISSSISGVANTVFYYHGSGGYNTAAANSIIANGSTWTHICFTRTSGGTLNLYVNGILSGAADRAAGTVVAGTANVVIGCREATSNEFDGIIDNIRIYDRELSAEEIQWIYDIESPGYHNFRDGKYMMKDGVPTLFTGIYHINSTDAIVAADVPTIKAAGYDFMFVYLDTTSWETVRAAWANDVELIPEDNGITEGTMDAIYGPFEIALAYDDLDSGCGVACDYSCADVQTRVAAIESTYSNSPLAYASAGLTGTDTSQFFDCDLDILGYQAYPLGDGSYTNEAIDAKNYYWAGYMASYNGPFLANTQAFEWPASDDINARQVMDVADYAELFYPAGFLPYAWDDGTWDIESDDDTEVLDGSNAAIAEAIRCGDWILKRAMTEW